MVGGGMVVWNGVGFVKCVIEDRLLMLALIDSDAQLVRVRKN